MREADAVNKVAVNSQTDECFILIHLFVDTVKPQARIRSRPVEATVLSVRTLIMTP